MPLSRDDLEELHRAAESARIGIRQARNSLRTALQLTAQLEDRIDQLIARPREAQRHERQHAATR